MLLTHSEFLEKCKSRNFDGLKLAYCIESGIFQTPIHIKKSSGAKVYIFDDSDFDLVSMLLDKHIKDAPKKIVSFVSSLLATRDIFSQEPGLSEELAAAITQCDIEKMYNELNKIPKQDLSQFLASLDETKTSSWFRKIRKSNISLGGKEQFDLIVFNTIIAATLNDKIIEFYLPKFRRFSENDAYDQCLKLYFRSRSNMGWGDFDVELELVKKMMGFEPSLLEWSIEKVFDFFDKLMVEYRELSETIYKYHEFIDPERKIALYIAYNMMYPKYKNIIDEAIALNKEKGQEITIKLQSFFVRFTEEAVSTILKKQILG
jgi:hypothetical protein